jgi:hypothetical protein
MGPINQLIVIPDRDRGADNLEKQLTGHPKIDRLIKAILVGIFPG